MKSMSSAYTPQDNQSAVPKARLAVFGRPSFLYTFGQNYLLYNRQNYYNIKT
ncbi:hypothetical protein TGS27_2116 [Geobacillus stearothermophilus]|uniref:Uncharacterized protein n=1 Tax=Geobacillus stearothermophilus TaxID=1422 RepID=A0A150MFN3_GEOSE|nr:hypothetical protein GS8_2642 [Geobacillus stearothermophilus]KYD23387.1 hypothetical protein B4109_2355 [Geobacillus stearothermophilus]OAO79684.1 hypothetical protein TGS27_2116 [Geobacillus stearothermophilus]